MAAAPITIVALSLIVGGMGLAGVSWQDLKERVKSASGRSRGERGDDYASTADDAGESNANADAERKNAERKNAERMNAERKNAERKNADRNADRNAERRANAERKNAERKNAERKNADNGKADNAKAANAEADKGRNAEPDDADRQDRKPFVPYPAPVGAKRQEVDPMGPPKFEPSGKEMGREMNALGMRNNVGMGDGGTGDVDHDDDHNDNDEERGEGRAF